jgi:hypothetical protein
MKEVIWVYLACLPLAACVDWAATLATVAISC